MMILSNNKSTNKSGLITVLFIAVSFINVVNCWMTTTRLSSKIPLQRQRHSICEKIPNLNEIRPTKALYLSSSRSQVKEEDEEKKDEVVIVGIDTPPGEEGGGGGAEEEEEQLDPTDFTVANKEAIESESFLKEQMERLKPDEDDDKYERDKDKYDSLREAIRARTEAIGIERADNTEFIKNLEQEYEQEKESSGQGSNVGGMGGGGGMGGSNVFGGIDMTQIQGYADSMGGGPGEQEQLSYDDIGPGGGSLKKEMAIDQDAIDKLFTKEEREEIAPWLKEPEWKALYEVFQKAEKPDFFAVLKKAAILLAVGFGYAWLQITFEEFYKAKLVELHIMPSQEEYDAAYDSLNIMDFDTTADTKTPIINTDAVLNKGGNSDSSNPDL